MTKETFTKHLTEDGIIEIYNYTFVYGFKGISILIDGERDTDLKDNGTYKVDEAWFIMRRVIGSSGHRVTPAKHSNQIKFGQCVGYIY